AGGLAAGGLAAGGLAEGGLAEGGLAEGGLAEGGLAEGGLAEGGLAAGGLAAGVSAASRRPAVRGASLGVGGLVPLNEVRSTSRDSVPPWAASAVEGDPALLSRRGPPPAGDPRVERAASRVTSPGRSPTPSPGSSLWPSPAAAPRRPRPPREPRRRFLGLPRAPATSPEASSRLSMEPLAVADAA
ncbi:MAG: hypothetical protein ACYCXN_11385, partial [Acidimicrobiales bacterium]